MEHQSSELSGVTLKGNAAFLASVIGSQWVVGNWRQYQSLCLRFLGTAVSESFCQSLGRRKVPVGIEGVVGQASCASSCWPLFVWLSVAPKPNSVTSDITPLSLAIFTTCTCYTKATALFAWQLSSDTDYLALTFFQNL